MKYVSRLKPWYRRFKANGYKLDRCAHCHHRFRWKNDSRYASGNRDGVHYHGVCFAYLERKRNAEECMDVIEVLIGLGPMDERDVKFIMSSRHGNEGWNKAFRVFYNIDRRRHRAESDHQQS